MVSSFSELASVFPGFSLVTQPFRVHLRGMVFVLDHHEFRARLAGDDATIRGC